MGVDSTGSISVHMPPIPPTTEAHAQSVSTYQPTNYDQPTDNSLYQPTDNNTLNQPTIHKPATNKPPHQPPTSKPSSKDDSAPPNDAILCFQPTLTPNPKPTTNSGDNGDNGDNDDNDTTRILWCLPALHPKPLNLDKQQSYKIHERDVIVRVSYDACDRLTSYLPKWLSPVILSFPGALMHLCLLILLLLTPRQRWMYTFFFCTKVVTFALDVMDGTHARNTNTQSTARHFWDHSWDVFNMILGSVIITYLAPPNTLGIVPPVFLLFVGPFVFYLGFLCYFATGKMLVPYNAHAYNYIYGVFLPMSVAVEGLDVLNSIVFQSAFATLSVLLQILAFVTILRYLYYIIRENKRWVCILLLALPAPLINMAIYVVWEYTLGPNMIIRIMASIVSGSYVLRLHAKQLRNEPIQPFTIEFGIYLGVIIGFGFPTIWIQYFLYILLVIMGSSWIFFVVQSIHKMIADFPDIGFPVFVITKTRAIVKEISNRSIHIARVAPLHRTI